MKTQTRIIFTDDHDEKFFGEGPLRLLKEVEKKGSLRAAAISMGMAYTKATKILKRAEEVLGFPLTTRSVGGVSGGGSCLTEEGKAWIQKYEAFRDACVEENRKRYEALFPEEALLTSQKEQKSASVQKESISGEIESSGWRSGCVIMASGLGKRFGGNKLMADFGGKPLIGWILERTEGIFDRRIVVTRHKDVAEYCRSFGVDTVVHALPFRSDTIRIGLENIGDVDCCMFCPGDQPLLSRQTLEILLKCSRDGREQIHRTCFGDREGAPVIFPKKYFGELKNLPEGKGGGVVLRKVPEKVCCVPVRREYELTDIDCPEDLKMLREYLNKTDGIGDQRVTK